MIYKSAASFAIFLSPAVLAVVRDSRKDAQPNLIPSVGITISNVNHFLNMSMAERPTLKFAGFFNTSDKYLLFSNCATPQFCYKDFESKNIKKVNVMGVSEILLTTERTHKIFAKDVRDLTTNWQFNIKETGRKPLRKCSAWGDPHYTLFNGHQSHDQQTGTVILYQSPLFEVQTRSGNCWAPGTASANCVKEMAVRYGSQWTVLRVPQWNSPPQDSESFKSGSPTFGFVYENPKYDNYGHADIQWIADDGAYISFALGYINIYVPEIYKIWYPEETGACTESPALFSNHIVHGGSRDFFSKNYRKNSTLVDVPPYFLCKGRAPVTKTVHSAIPFFTPT